jgi:hypothetical protein
VATALVKDALRHPDDFTTFFDDDHLSASEVVGAWLRAG